MRFSILLAASAVAGLGLAVAANNDADAARHCTHYTRGPRDIAAMALHPHCTHLSRSPRDVAPTTLHIEYKATASDDGDEVHEDTRPPFITSAVGKRDDSILPHHTSTHRTCHPGNKHHKSCLSWTTHHPTSTKTSTSAITSKNEPSETPILRGRSWPPVSGVPCIPVQLPGDVSWPPVCTNHMQSAAESPAETAPPAFRGRAWPPVGGVPCVPVKRANDPSWPPVCTSQGSA